MVYIAAPSRNCVRPATCIASTSWRTTSALTSSASTNGSSRAPWLVSVMLRVVRWNSGWPIACSSSLSCPETVGWVRFSRSAARVTDPSAAIAAKLRNRRSSG